MKNIKKMTFAPLLVATAAVFMHVPTAEAGLFGFGTKKKSVRPPEECLRSVAALMQCRDNGTISQDDYDMFYESVLFIDQTTNVGQNQLQYTPQRCEGDSLDAAQARGRTNWAIKCLTGMLPPKTIGDLKDMVAKGRPHYPTFGIYAVGNDGKPSWSYPTGGARAPLKEAASCDLITKENWRISGYCVSGCYSPEQRVLSENGYEAIGGALSNRKTVSLITLNKDSTNEALKFASTPVDTFIQSKEPVNHELVVIKTAAGRNLRVTKNHPLVVSSGVMKKAEDLHVGDELMSATGGMDKIESLSNEAFFGKVHNMYVKSTDPMKNVVVAEGLLQGTARFQNEDVALLNRVLLRSQTPNKLVRK